MKITKIADTSSSDKRAIQNLEKDVRDINKDIKDLQRDFREINKSFKDLKKNLNDLNIGTRVFFQHKTVFNSLQRKIERFEAVEKEWVKYKNNMDKEMKALVSKMSRARVTLK